MHTIPTSVSFQTADKKLQAIFNGAEAKSKENLRDFCGRTVLIEGGGYHKIWLETQPMGGEMYAKRNLEAAMNNTLLFLEHQRADGRIPGSITVEDGRILPQFNKFQGFCLPAHALNLYYWNEKSADYLPQLYEALEKFDAYLWRVRDSNQDGLLESWCVYDTGEDNGTRYGDAPCWWEEETPPEGFSVVPMASMDITSFSFSARNTLAKISTILQNGQTDHWNRQAGVVKALIGDRFWIPERGACFDRDKNGAIVPALSHNTLRCMYWESLPREMGVRFVNEHLLNPAEFWTPMPLPSVAANDPYFRNCPDNDWSGQAQGLTYQRAIRALEQYGFAHLVPVLGEKLFWAIGQRGIFTQQFDPFTGTPSGEKDGYGPTMLAVLEYVSRLYGIHLEGEEILWGAFGGRETDYTQCWGDRSYRICSDGKTAEGFYNGKRVFITDCGVQMVTDYTGNPLRVHSLCQS